MNKYKKLASNTIVFAIGGFGSKILAFLLTRLYTANLESSLFNVKEVLELCANLLIPMVSFSIADAIIRYGLDRNYDKQSVFSNAVTVMIFGGGAFVILSPLLCLYSDIRHYVPLLILYVLCSCFRQLSTQFARARNFVKLYAADGIFCTLVFFLFNLVLVGWLKLGIAGFMLSNICADLISGMTVWWLAQHRRFLAKQYIDRELLAVMLRFSLPLIPAAVLWLITGFSDRIFLRHMVSDTDAGVYGAATKIPNLISMVSTIFYQAWNMSAIAENDSRDRSRFYTTVFEAYQAMLVLSAGVLIALDRQFSAVLIDVSKDAAYERAYLYTPLLVISVLLMCYDQFLSSVYTVTKHTKNSLWSSLAAAVLNLFLNAVMIPKHGVYGAIIATLASYFICYLIRIIDTQRFVPFRVYHGRFAANIGILLAMCYTVSRTDPMNPANQHIRSLVPVWLALGLTVLAALNYRPLAETVKKLLRR